MTRDVNIKFAISIIIVCVFSVCCNNSQNNTSKDEIIENRIDKIYNLTEIKSVKDILKELKTKKSIPDKSEFENWETFIENLDRNSIKVKLFAYQDLKYDDEILQRIEYNAEIENIIYKDVILWFDWTTKQINNDNYDGQFAFKPKNYSSKNEIYQLHADFVSAKSFEKKSSYPSVTAIYPNKTKATGLHVEFSFPCPKDKARDFKIGFLIDGVLYGYRNGDKKNHQTLYFNADKTKVYIFDVESKKILQPITFRTGY